MQHFECAVVVHLTLGSVEVRTPLALREEVTPVNEATAGESKRALTYSIDAFETCYSAPGQ